MYILKLTPHKSTLDRKTREFYQEQNGVNDNKTMFFSVNIKSGTLMRKSYILVSVNI